MSNPRRKMSAQEAIRTQDMLIRHVLHDIKNPLAVTMGYLEVIQKIYQAKVPPQIMGFIESALAGCRGQLEIIDCFADLIKLENRDLHVNVKPVEAISILKDKIDLYAENDAKISYWFQDSSGEVYVEADERLITEVFHILLKRARRCTREGGIVEAVVIRAGKGKFTRIHIDDGGEIIPVEHRKSIFNRFSEAQVSELAGRWDSGLALPFVAAAMKAMGGGAVITVSPQNRSRVELSFILADPPQSSGNA